MFSDRELKRLEGFVEILEDGAEVKLVKERAFDEVAVAEYDQGFSELLADAIREFVDRYTETEAVENG